MAPKNTKVTDAEYYFKDESASWLNEEDMRRALSKMPTHSQLAVAPLFFKKDYKDYGLREFEHIARSQLDNKTYPCSLLIPYNVSGAHFAMIAVTLEKVDGKTTLSSGSAQLFNDDEANLEGYNCAKTSLAKLGIELLEEPSKCFPRNGKKVLSDGLGNCGIVVLEYVERIAENKQQKNSDQNLETLFASKGTNEVETIRQKFLEREYFPRRNIEEKGEFLVKKYSLVENVAGILCEKDPVFRAAAFIFVNKLTDLLLKKDGDQKLHDEGVIEAVIELFEKNPRPKTFELKIGEEVLVSEKEFNKILDETREIEDYTLTLDNLKKSDPFRDELCKERLKNHSIGEAEALQITGHLSPAENKQIYDALAEGSDSKNLRAVILQIILEKKRYVFEADCVEDATEKENKIGELLNLKKYLEAEVSESKALKALHFLTSIKGEVGYEDYHKNHSVISLIEGEKNDVDYSVNDMKGKVGKLLGAYITDEVKGKISQKLQFSTIDLNADGLTKDSKLTKDQAEQLKPLFAGSFDEKSGFSKIMAPQYSLEGFTLGSVLLAIGGNNEALNDEISKKSTDLREKLSNTLFTSALGVEENKKEKILNAIFLAKTPAEIEVFRKELKKKPAEDVTFLEGVLGVNNNNTNNWPVVKDVTGKPQQMSVLMGMIADDGVAKEAKLFSDLLKQPNISNLKDPLEKLAQKPTSHQLRQFIDAEKGPEQNKKFAPILALILEDRASSADVDESARLKLVAQNLRDGNVGTVAFLGMLTCAQGSTLDAADKNSGLGTLEEGIFGVSANETVAETVKRINGGSDLDSDLEVLLKKLPTLHQLRISAAKNEDSRDVKLDKGALKRFEEQCGLPPYGKEKLEEGSSDEEKKFAKIQYQQGYLRFIVQEYAERTAAGFITTEDKKVSEANWVSIGQEGFGDSGNNITILGVVGKRPEGRSGALAGGLGDKIFEEQFNLAQIILAKTGLSAEKKAKFRQKLIAADNVEVSEDGQTFTFLNRLDAAELLKIQAKTTTRETLEELGEALIAEAIYGAKSSDISEEDFFEIFKEALPIKDGELSEGAEGILRKMLGAIKELPKKPEKLGQSATDEDKKSYKKENDAAVKAYEGTVEIHFANLLEETYEGRTLFNAIHELQKNAISVSVSDTTFAQANAFAPITKLKDDDGKIKAINRVGKPAINMPRSVSRIVTNVEDDHPLKVLLNRSNLAAKTVGADLEKLTYEFKGFEINDDPLDLAADLLVKIAAGQFGPGKAYPHEGLAHAIAALAKIETKLENVEIKALFALKVALKMRENESFGKISAENQDLKTLLEAKFGYLFNDNAGLEVGLGGQNVQKVDAGVGEAKFDNLFNLMTGVDFEAIKAAQKKVAKIPQDLAAFFGDGSLEKAAINLELVDILNGFFGNGDKPNYVGDGEIDGKMAAPAGREEFRKNIERLVPELLKLPNVTAAFGVDDHPTTHHNFLGNLLKDETFRSAWAAHAKIHLSDEGKTALESLVGSKSDETGIDNLVSALNSLAPFSDVNFLKKAGMPQIIQAVGGDGNPKTVGIKIGEEYYPAWLKFDGSIQMGSKATTLEELKKNGGVERAVNEVSAWPDHCFNETEKAFPDWLSKLFKDVDLSADDKLSINAQLKDKILADSAAGEENPTKKIEIELKGGRKFNIVLKGRNAAIENYSPLFNEAQGINVEAMKDALLLAFNNKSLDEGGGKYIDIFTGIAHNFCVKNKVLDKVNFLVPALQLMHSMRNVAGFDAETFAEDISKSLAAIVGDRNGVDMKAGVSIDELVVKYNDGKEDGQKIQAPEENGRLQYAVVIPKGATLGIGGLNEIQGATKEMQEAAIKAGVGYYEVESKDLLAQLGLQGEAEKKVDQFIEKLKALVLDKEKVAGVKKAFAGNDEKEKINALVAALNGCSNLPIKAELDVFLQNFSNSKDELAEADRTSFLNDLVSFVNDDNKAEALKNLKEHVDSPSSSPSRANASKIEGYDKGSKNPLVIAGLLQVGDNVSQYKPAEEYADALNAILNPIFGKGSIIQQHQAYRESLNDHENANDGNFTEPKVYSGFGAKTKDDGGAKVSENTVTLVIGLITLGSLAQDLGLKEGSKITLDNCVGDNDEDKIKEAFKRMRNLNFGEKGADIKISIDGVSQLADLSEKQLQHISAERKCATTFTKNKDGSYLATRVPEIRKMMSAGKEMAL